MSLSCDPAQPEQGFCQHGKPLNQGCCYTIQNTLSVCVHGAPVKFGRCLLCNPMERKTVNIGDLIDELISLRNRIEALHEHKLRQIDENRKVSKHLDSIDASTKVHNKIEERFDKLEKFHSDWNKMPKFDLHTWQEGIQKQINDVIGLFVKADSVLENDIIKLQQSREAHSRSHKDIFDRIEKLEKLYSSSTDVEQGLLNRINELEDKLENIIPRVWSAEQKGLIAMDAIEGNGRFKGKSPHKCPVCEGNGSIIDNLIYIEKYSDVKIITCNGCKGRGVVWG